MKRKNQNKNIVIKNPTNYINNNIIFQFRYTNPMLNSKEKIQSITPNFELFLNLYTKNIKKVDRKFPQLKIDSIQIIRPQYKKNIFYKFIYTQPFNNHPFLVYGDLNENTYKIMMPFGDKLGQSDINVFYQYVNFLNKDDKVAVYTLINRTINIRKKNILQNPKFSLLKCENIKGCINKTKSLNKKNYANYIKKKIQKENEEEYKQKALNLLKKYFDLLEINQFESAEDLLTGKYGHFSNQSRIDNFFIGKKTIIGHLKIFISLYKMYNEIIRKI
jgi:hypothetical protein